MSTALAPQLDVDSLKTEVSDCDALLLELERSKLKKSLYDFLLGAWHVVEPSQPFVETWHVRVLCQLLQDVVLGKEPQKRWVINIPPGTLKSLLVSVIMPAWVWARSGDKRFLTASYGQTLTIRDNLRVRDIVTSEWFQERFPLKLVEDQNTKTRFNTGKGGWRIATSVGGQAIGEHPDFIIIDDAATAKQAESPGERKTVHEWYDRTISPRGITRPNLIVFVVGQRLHQEDLPGYLLERGGWGHVKFPMRYVPTRAASDHDKGYTADPRDPRKEAGELLAPQLITPERVKEKELDLGEYGTSGQFQQEPAPEGGGQFKHEWFKFADAAPARMRIARGWDTAATEDDGDYTCGVKIGEEFEHVKGEGLKSTGRFFILDVIRQQLSPAGVEAIMIQTANADGKVVAQREEKEGGSSGKTVIQARARSLKGFNYAGVTVSGSKSLRAKPFRTQCEAGNVYLLRKPWNREYIAELTNFPTGKHDDQVDGSSTAFNAVLLEDPPTQYDCVW